MWNKTFAHESGEIEVFGLFAPGVSSFEEGAVSWVESGVENRKSSRWISSGIHSSHLPVIYVKSWNLPPERRLGVRLTDEKGHHWTTISQPLNDIWPFPIELGPEIESVIPEVVVLRPIEATFQVRTPDMND